MLRADGRLPRQGKGNRDNVHWRGNRDNVQWRINVTMGSQHWFLSYDFFLFSLCVLYVCYRKWPGSQATQDWHNYKFTSFHVLPVVARSYLCQTILPMLLMPNGQRWTLNLLMAKSIPSLSFWISFFFLRLSLSKFYYSSNTCLKIVVTSMSSRPMETFVFFLSFNNLIQKYFNFCHH